MERKERRAVIRSNSTIINLLRRYSKSDRTELASMAGVSWPTIDRMVKNLPQSEINSPVKFGQTENTVSAAFAQYVGISIEPMRITSACVGLDFKDFGMRQEDKDEICNIAKKCNVLLDIQTTDYDKIIIHVDNKHDENLGSIITHLENIITFYIQLCGTFDYFHIVGITIAIPGIIDFNTKELVIRFCPNIKYLQSVPATKLIKSDIREQIENADIMLYFEHDTQGAMLNALSTLPNDDYEIGVGINKIAACVMIDAGIGLSVISSGEMLRGRGSFGELGHLKMPYDNLLEEQKDVEIQKCDCGKSDCFEINFRNRVLNSYSNSEFEQNTSQEALKERFNNDDSVAYRLLRNYIGYIMNILGTLLNTDLVLFCGRLIENMDILSNDLETVYLENVIGATTASCKILPVKTNKFYIAIGAAIASYYACNEERSFPKIRLL